MRNFLIHADELGVRTVMGNADPWFFFSGTVRTFHGQISPLIRFHSISSCFFGLLS